MSTQLFRLFFVQVKNGQTKCQYVMIMMTLLFSNQCVLQCRDCYLPFALKNHPVDIVNGTLCRAHCINNVSMLQQTNCFLITCQQARIVTIVASLSSLNASCGVTISPPAPGATRPSCFSTGSASRRTSGSSRT